MTFDDFVQLLVTECEATGNTTWVEGLKNEAREKLTDAGGEISQLTNSSLNGKSFERRIQFSAADVMRACQRAIGIYNETDAGVPASYADFSQVNR